MNKYELLSLCALLGGLPIACTSLDAEERDDELVEATTGDEIDASMSAEPTPESLVWQTLAEPPPPAGHETSTALRTPRDVPEIPLPADEIDLAAAPAEPLAAGFLASNGYYDHFGRALAVGDFNDDGWDDVAVGAPFESQSMVSAGAVYVYCGSATSLQPCAQVNQIGVVERFDRFGWALAAGDFDGDGVDDLAVSAPWEGPAGDPSSGAIFIYHGSTGATMLVPDDWYDQESLSFGGNEKGDRFGWALAAADFDGDQIDDLAIGAPGETPGSSPRSGAVFVAQGGGNGLTGMTTLTQSGASTMHAEERFGASLAAGHVLDGSCNDCAELVVGSFNDVVTHRSGRVFVYRGTGSGPTLAQTLTQWSWDENNDDFGFAVAVGDFDGDGHGDVAVGAPGENRDEGRVFVHYSDGAQLQSGDLLAQFSGQTPGDRFGASLAVGRLNPDGYDDLVVGAPRATSAGVKRGRVSQFLGQPGGMIQWASMLATPLDPQAGDGWYGHALAVGNFLGDADEDLVVGAPNDNVSQPSDGAGYLYRDGLVGIARLVQAAP